MWPHIVNATIIGYMNINKASIHTLTSQLLAIENISSYISSCKNIVIPMIIEMKLLYLVRWSQGPHIHTFYPLTLLFKIKTIHIQTLHHGKGPLFSQTLSGSLWPPAPLKVLSTVHVFAEKTSTSSEINCQRFAMWLTAAWNGDTRENRASDVVSVNICVCGGVSLFIFRTHTACCLHFNPLMISTLTTLRNQIFWFHTFITL